MARPHQVVNSSNDTTSKEMTQPPAKELNLESENLILTQPPPPPKIKKNSHFYPYTQSVSPRLGTLVNLHEFREDMGSSFKMLYGFSYLFPRNHSPQLEVGADIIESLNGQFHIAKRWIINERYSFRPYYKLGATVVALGREGLATFTNIDNYLAKASLGLEDYYKEPMSLRWELEVGGGLEYFFLYLTFGYSWGF